MATSSQKDTLSSQKKHKANNTLMAQPTDDRLLDGP